MPEYYMMNSDYKVTHIVLGLGSKEAHKNGTHPYKYIYLSINCEALNAGEQLIEYYIVLLCYQFH